MRLNQLFTNRGNRRQTRSTGNQAPEQLEARTMLTTAAIVPNAKGNVLQITGTSRSETIIVRQRNCVGGGTCISVDSGTAYRANETERFRLPAAPAGQKGNVGDFSTARFNQISVDGLGGNDYIIMLDSGRLKRAPGQYLTTEGGAGFTTFFDDRGQRGAGITLNGGSGSDTILGGRGYEEINGGPHGDELRGRVGGDTINGGEGQDSIYGGQGRDEIHGGPRNDVIEGGRAADLIYGDGGNDSIKGERGIDSIMGGTGADRINGGADRDYISGDQGNDCLFGSGGLDLIGGGAGADVIYGGSSTDKLWGDSYFDKRVRKAPRGASGGDRISGDSGNDFLYGEAANDTLAGGSGSDELNGGTGRDRLWGDMQLKSNCDAPDLEPARVPGRDTMRGGPGIDRIDGGGDNDRIAWAPGHGSDVIAAGEGDDELAMLNLQTLADLAIARIGDVTYVSPEGSGDRVILGQAVGDHAAGDYVQLSRIGNARIAEPSQQCSAPSLQAANEYGIYIDDYGPYHTDNDDGCGFGRVTEAPNLVTTGLDQVFAMSRDGEEWRFDL